jgi:uncharacterized membrane protein
VRALPRTSGAHSAILRVDDPSTPGVDKLVLATVVAASAPTAPADSVTQHGTVARNDTRSLFVTVPAGTQALRVDLSGLAKGSQTRFIATDPQGLPVDGNATSDCYANYSDESACASGSRSYAHPMAGVWEIQVDSRRTTPELTNPYTLTAAVQGVTLDPATGTVDQAAVHEPVERTFTATDAFGPVTVHPVSGTLGAMEQVRGNVADQQETDGQITVPRDAERLEVSIGDPADQQADLDLYLVDSTGALVASSVHGGSEESVSVDRPAPGFYHAVIAGTRVPSGSTAFTVQDTVFSDSLGSVTVDGAKPVRLTHGRGLTFRGRLVADTQPPAGRQLIARFGVADDKGVTLGSTDLVVGQVTQPQATVLASYGPATAAGLTDTGQIGGSEQIDSRTTPVRWDQQHGAVRLDAGGATSGYVLGQSSTAGYAVGQLTLPSPTGTRGGLWNSAGDLTVLPLPDWQTYTFDRAFAVNDSGLVVGNATGMVTDPATGRQIGVNNGFAWTAAGGFQRLTDLSSDASQTEPLAVNDAGTIVGDAQLSGHREAAKWNADGSVTDLGTLPGMSDSTAQAISPSGIIVGTSGDDAFVLRPGGTMTRLPDFGFDAQALAVNDSGWILGTAEVQPDQDTAVVWDPQGRMYDLNAMVDQAHWEVQEGVGLNSSNQVAFYAADKTEEGTTKVVLAQL